MAVAVEIEGERVGLRHRERRHVVVEDGAETLGIGERDVLRCREGQGVGLVGLGEVVAEDRHRHHRGGRAGRQLEETACRLEVGAFGGRAGLGGEGHRDRQAARGGEGDDEASRRGAGVALGEAGVGDCQERRRVLVEDGAEGLGVAERGMER